MKKTIISLLLTITLLLSFAACKTALPPADGNAVAVAIVLGRHANANEFPEVYYQQITEDVQRAVYGGFVSVIISDGSPREIALTDKNGKGISFDSDANNDTIRTRRIENRTNTVMDFLKDTNNRAVVPENDLLRAIKEARASLNNPAIPADAEKKIIILDTCVSTAGDFRLQDLGLEYQRPEPEAVLAELTKAEGILPDLSGISVRVIGLGDVAAPQTITDETKLYLKGLWKAILDACGAELEDIDILVAGIGGHDGITSGSFANENAETDGSGKYPSVTVVNMHRNQ